MKSSAREIHGCIRHHVKVKQRLVVGQRELSIKLGVLGGLHRGRGLPPQRRTPVDGLRRRLFGVRGNVFTFGGFGSALHALDIDREGDIVGVFADRALQAPGLRKFPGIFLEVNVDFGASILLVRRFQSKTAVARGTPAPRLLLRTVGSRSHGDAVGHHEHGVESHTKLADDLLLRRLPLARVEQKGARTGVCNCAQVLDQLVTVHADAAVADCQGAIGRVGAQVNRQFAFCIHNLVVGEHFKLNAIERIRCIGYEFAQEDGAVGVERMREDVEQLLDLGAVLERFAGSAGIVGHGRLQLKMGASVRAFLAPTGWRK